MTMLIQRLPLVSTRSCRCLRRFVAFSAFYFLAGVIFLKLPVTVVETSDDRINQVYDRFATSPSDTLPVEVGERKMNSSLDTLPVEVGERKMDSSLDTLPVEVGERKMDSSPDTLPVEVEVGERKMDSSPDTLPVEVGERIMESSSDPVSPSVANSSYSPYHSRRENFLKSLPSSTDTQYDLPEQTGYFNGEQLVVHVTWFYQPRTDFRFHEAICLLAIQRYVRPRKILFWYDSASTPPSGIWWQFARQSVAHLLPVPVERPTSVFNRTVHVPEHQSDLVRLAVLEDLGGLYVDLDLIIVRPIDDLLRRIADKTTSASAQSTSLTEVVMGAETPEMLGSGFILSPRPKSEFLRRWRQAYADGFVDSDWNRHSVYVPMELARRHPGLVHVEWFAINRPNWHEREWLYGTGRLWDWSANYALHLWFRDRPVGDVDYDPVTIRSLNTTVGEVFRHIYYGHTELLPPHLD